MKVKQQTLKGFEFEIDDEAAFEEYYEKNAPLLKGHLLILRGKVSSSTQRFLDERSAAYVNANEKSIVTRKRREETVIEDSAIKPSVNTAMVSDAVVIPENCVYYRPIRSGEEIESDSDLVFFSRINSGAVIESSRSIQIFGIIDGLVRSEGEYLILREIGKGTVVFHGEELSKSQLDGRLKLIQYKDGIVIKDILG